MTVLAEYQRLEAEGIWRPSPDEQRRDVIVSIGEATLTLTTPNGAPLAHWSLPALIQRNPGEMPALLSPGRDSTETLEIADTEMMEAITRVMGAIRRRPRQGRWLGRGTRVAVLAAALFGLAFWVPGAIANYTARLVPPVAQAQIGADLVAEVERLTGAPCATPSGTQALQKLAARLFPGGTTRLVVLPSTLKTTSHVPGGTLFLSHTLVEDYEVPEVVAGYAMAEHLRAREGKTLARLLEASPFRASLALLSQGKLREVDLQRMAEELVVRAPDAVDDAALRQALVSRQVASAPYAYATDITGETSASLIADTPEAVPALSDTDWIALQSICSE